MRFNKIILAVTCIVAAAHFSCKKKLELEPKDSLSTEQALSNMKGVNAAVVGMYASARSSNYYGRSLFIYGDLSSNDVYLSKSNSNRYVSTYQKNYAAVDADILNMWAAMYNTVARANNILNAIDAVEGTKAEKDLIKGQALFMRSLAYFDLVRIFAKPYNQGNGSQLGVPLVFKSDINQTPGRNTVAEVYTQIINDLNTAKALLATTTAATRFTASKYAVSALLSRIYLYKGDNANAITEANAVTAGSFSLATAAQLPTFYGTPGTSEEIFTVKFEDVETNTTNNLGNMYMKPGYGDVRVSPDLVNSFDQVNDLRYKNYIGPFSTSPSEYQNNKFKSQNGLFGLYSPKVLRIAEIILNRAEAYAKSSQAPQALADLNQIRTARGLAPAVGLTGQALIDAILEERRHELMFEGQRFFDMVRNGITIVKTYCNQLTQVTTTNCTLAANDNKVIAPIPQVELNANPGLNGQQNPGY